MKLFYFILILVALLGVVGFFSIPTLKEARRSRIIQAEIASLEAEAEKLDSENNFLREKIEYLKSDYYKESVAKDRLSLRNKGEKIVVVQPNSEVLGADTDFSREELKKEEKMGSEDENMPNYEKWWLFISKRK